MSQANALSASLEDYLEAIFNIISANGRVRVKDIAGRLGVKAGSVTTALQALTKNGYINYKPYGIITLTSKGLEQAQKVTRKHEILQRFFVEILGADSQEAETGACKIEHVISDKLLDRLVTFAGFIKSCPQGNNGMIESFHRFYENLADTPFAKKEDCQSCFG